MFEPPEWYYSNLHGACRHITKIFLMVEGEWQVGSKKCLTSENVRRATQKEIHHYGWWVVELMLPVISILTSCCPAITVDPSSTKNSTMTPLTGEVTAIDVWRWTKYSNRNLEFHSCRSFNLTSDFLPIDKLAPQPAPTYHIIYYVSMNNVNYISN